MQFNQENLGKDNLRVKIKKLINENNYSLAEEICISILEKDPLNISALNALGEISKAKGELFEAQLLFEKALKINSEKIETIDNLFNLYNLLDDQTKIKELFIKLYNTKDLKLNYFNSSINSKIANELEEVYPGSALRKIFKELKSIFNNLVYLPIWNHNPQNISEWKESSINFSVFENVIIISNYLIPELHNYLKSKVKSLPGSISIKESFDILQTSFRLIFKELNRTFEGLQKEKLRNGISKEEWFNNFENRPEKELLQKFNSFIEKSKINSVLLHGSLADGNTEKGFSDFDVTYIIDVTKPGSNLFEIAEEILESNIYLLSYNPFMHHGPMITFKDELNWTTEASFPSVLVENGVWVKNPIEEINYINDGLDFITPFTVFRNYFDNQFNKYCDFKNPFDIIWWASSVTFLPLLIRQMFDGKSIWKKDFFENELNSFPYKYKNLLENVSIIRVNGAKLIREKIKLPLQLEDYEKNPGLILKKYKEQIKIREEEVYSIGITNDLINKAKDFMDYAENCAFYFHYKNKINKNCETEETGKQKYYFTELPKKLNHEDYEEARNYFLSMCKDKDYIISVYEFGNVGCPGLSDLDFLVVLKNDFAGTPSELIIDNMPYKYAEILSHNPVFICEENASILGAVYPIFNYKKLYGKDIHLKLSSEFSYNNQLSLFTFLNLIKYPKDIFTLAKEPKIRWKTILAYLNSFNHVAKIFNQLNIEIPASINNCLGINKSIRDKFKTENISVEQFPDVLNALISASVDMLLKFENLWSEKIPELLTICSLSERGNYIKYLYDLLNDNKNVSPDLPPILNTLLLSLEKVEDKIEIPLDLFEELDKYNIKYLKHRLEFLYREISHKRFPDHYIIGNLFETVTKDLSGSNFILFNEEYLERPQHKWVNLKLKLFENKFSFESSKAELDYAIQSWVWFNVAQDKNIYDKTIAVIGGGNSIITWLLSLKGAKVYLLNPEQNQSIKGDELNEKFNTNVEVKTFRDDAILSDNEKADVVINLSGNVLNDKSSFINEVLKILKPNGQLIFPFDFTSSNNSIDLTNPGKNIFNIEELDNLFLNNPNFKAFDNEVDKTKYKQWLLTAASQNDDNISTGIIINKNPIYQNEKIDKEIKIKPTKYNTPILFLIFNRPEYTQRVFDEIKKIAPAKFYIAADGPRRNNEKDKVNCNLTRQIVNQIDWNCKVVKLFREENLGCKIAVSSAINWFFENEEQGIILEDDILPSHGFFEFAAEMLNKYADDERIMHVAGNNLQFGWRRNNDSYYYSYYGSIWGWATWRRAWKLYDVEMKMYPKFLKENRLYEIFGNDDEVQFRKNTFDQVFSKNLDTWDFQWTFARLANNGLSIVPNFNLIKNIGFGQEATHTTSTSDKRANLLLEKIDSPLMHPEFMVRDKVSDDRYFNNVINPKPKNLKTTKFATKSQNILFIRLDAIGDSILASSMLKEIKNNYKEYNITVLCQDFVAELYETNPYVKNIIKVNKRRIITDKEYLNSIQNEIINLAPAYVLNSTYSRDNFADYLSTFYKDSTRIAHQGNLSNITLNDKTRNDGLYSRLISNNEKSFTELDKHSDFLSGLNIKHNVLTPSIYLTKDDEKFAIEVFEKNNLKKENTIALFCGAQSNIRHYEKFGEAVNKFSKENDFNVVILGSSKDHLINNKNINGISSKVVNLTGKTTIKQSAAIIKNCLIAVGAETGLAHISCAVGTPNVILVGGGHFGRFIPYSSLTSVVSLPLDCFGCNWQCKYGYPICVKEVDSDIIYKALSEKLNSDNSKIKIYSQSEYQSDFISYFPKISDPQKWLKENDYEFVELPKKTYKTTESKNQEILKYIENLSLGNDLKEKFKDLYETYLNNLKNFEKVEKLENIISINVHESVLIEISKKFNNGFTYYLLALKLENNKKDDDAIEYYEKSLKYCINYRALYLNALLMEKLNKFNRAVWLYADLLKSGINVEEIKSRIEIIKKVLKVNLSNRINLINKKEINKPQLYIGNNTDIDISIVLPSKNRFEGLNAFLQGLEYSCYKMNYEVLLYAGNEINDEYRKLIEKYKIKKVFLDSDVLERNEKFSWTKLMRHGFNNAEGKWIMYASDDIIMHPFAFNYALSLDNDKSIGGISFMHKNAVHDYNGFYKDYGYDVLVDRAYINFGLIRKESYQNIKGFDTQFYFYSGDTDVCWQLIDKGYKIINSEYSLVEHINIEDKIKNDNSSDIYEHDVKMFLKKWINYLEQFNGEVIKNRFYLDNILNIKEHIYNEAISNEINLDYLCSIDPDYKKFSTTNFKKEENAKVSAIISTYNSERFIKSCLDDLVNQTLYQKNQLEIIVINSGSEQNEEDIVKEYQKHFNNIVYQKTEKETIYQAWNRGIKLATGIYITNANTDDRHSADAFEKMVNVLDKNENVDVVYANVYKTDVENDNLNSSTEKTLINWPDFDKDLLLFGCFIGPQPVWRKSLHEKFGYFDESLKVVGDYEFWLRISSGAKFYHLNEPLGLYLFSENSAEHRDNQTTNAEDVEVKNKYLIKHIPSLQKLERIKEKIMTLQQAENLKEYSKVALTRLEQREKGIKLEEEIKHRIVFPENINRLNLLLNKLENSDILINKNLYSEVLHLTIGSMLLKENDLINSRTEFEKALNINPESSEACTGLAEIFFIEENYEAADTMFDWALKNNPDNKIALERRNQLTLLINQDDEKEILDENLLTKAVEYFSNKDYQKAELELSSAEKKFNGQLSKEENSEFASVFYNVRGYNFLGLQEPEKAQQCFESALIKNPNSSQACAGLGEIFYLNDQLDESKVMFEWAVKNNAQNDFAVKGLNKINQKLGFEQNHNSLLIEN